MKIEIDKQNHVNKWKKYDGWSRAKLVDKLDRIRATLPMDGMDRRDPHTHTSSIRIEVEG